MAGQFKKVVALLIAVVPIRRLRIALWNTLLGYQIHKSARVSLFNFIAVDSFVVGEKTLIGPFNIFKGPFTSSIGSNSRIGRWNKFTCGSHLTDPRFAHMNYARKLFIGDKCLVLDGHFFDVYGLVELGHGTWIAGIDGQFWTHGVSAMDRDIVIGSGNYIGSGVKFAPGSGIGNDNIVSLGTVVLSKLGGNDMLISGFPAKEIKSIAEKKSEGRYRFTFEDW